MRRRLIAGVAALAMFVAVASPAAAQASPGSFPEQPGENVATGCEAVLANTFTGTANMSATANAIASGLILDACFGG